MSANFTFPPPPPPPPVKSRTNYEDRSSGTSQFDHGRGRGSMHPSRGLNRESWRGNHASRPQRRGGFVSRQNEDHQSHQSNPRDNSNGRRSFSDHNENSGYQQERRAGFDRSAAGHKRKLQAFRDPDVRSERRHAPPTAPAVPSFGLVIPPASVPIKESKRPRNYLGLTPANVDDTSTFPDSEEDEASGLDEDVDEEALYAELGSKLTFEHNGEVISLNSTADISKWIDERKRNWPTDARISERAANRVRVGFERQRLLDGARRILQGDMDPSRKVQTPVNYPNAVTQIQESQQPSRPDITIARSELSNRESELAELRERVRKSQELRALAKKQVSEQIDDNERQAGEPSAVQDQAEHDNDHESGMGSNLSGSSVLSSDSDDDDSPEEFTNKQAIDKREPNLICRYHFALGGCQDGSACRFSHEGLPPAAPQGRPKPKARTEATSFSKPSESSSKRTALYETLMEQQRKEEDRLALKVVKFLGGTGFFRVNDD